MVSLISFAVTVEQLIPYFIAGGAMVLILIFSIIGIIMRAKKRPKGTPRIIDRSAYMEALGGDDNVIEHTRKGSRIELKLKDYDAIDKEKLKEAGVDGFIKMSDRLTLVIKGDAEQVERTLFGTNGD